MTLQINEKLSFFYTKKIRYKSARGGRNGGKSHDAATSLLLLGTQRQTLNLCLREYQKNLEDSVHRLLADKINQEAKFREFYTIQRDTIYGTNGTEFRFSGIKNARNIKSFEGADYAWVEEAQTLSEDSLRILTPTIRKPGSELWFTYNPEAKTDPIYQFTVEKPMSNDLLGKLNGQLDFKYDAVMESVLINYDENPNCPGIMIFEAEEMRDNNYALYEHIWLGKPLDITDDVIFKGRFVVQELEIEWYKNKPYYNQNFLPVYCGMDFGFSSDPAAMVEIFLVDPKTIYINREIYQTGLLPSKYIETIKQHIPEAILTHGKWWADCSRPDSIAQLQHDGLQVVGALKPKESVESGIEWLQGMKIIINPRCRNMIYEAHNYKYRTDALTGKILRDPLDANNHLWDAIRYALSEKIQAKKGMITFSAADLAMLERR